MMQVEFETLVHSLEPVAAADPAAWGRRVGALAVCGDAWTAARIAVLAAGLAAASCLAPLPPVALASGGSALLLGAIALTRRARRARPGLPGVAVSARELPRLHVLIERVRVAAGAPRLAGVRITGDFNAAVVHSRRPGGLRAHGHLLVGLPLLEALTAPELTAVIAHEMGHLRGRDAGLASRLLRLRRRFSPHDERRPARARGPGARFRAWYVPRLKAYACVQARQAEYQADAVSVQVVGARVTAAALIRVCMEGEFIGELFWPAIFRRADREPVPVLAPQALLGAALRARRPSLAQHAALARALAQPTGVRDTHPSLSDRLQRLRVEPWVPEPVAASAAELLLGTAVTRLREQLDASWRAAVGDWWRERHARGSRARLRLMSLERAALRGACAEADLWERARLNEALGNEASAAALYDELLTRNAGHAGARWRRHTLRSPARRPD